MLLTSTQDRIRILRLDAPPMNTLTVPMLQALGDAVEEADREDAVHGILVIGREDFFSAGADVHLFQQLQTADDATDLSQRFQDALRRVEAARKPVAAALAGTVVGGALELAMACHYRVAVQGARFRMPEVSLGINPGAGGTQRLPRLVGVPFALRMLLDAEWVSTQEAHNVGLVDAVCDVDMLQLSGCEFLRKQQGPRRTSQRTDRIGEREHNRAAFEQAADRVAQRRPEWIAPSRILDLVRIGIEDSVPRGLRREQTAFAECMATSAVRNKIDLFFATAQTSKVPEVQGIDPLPLRRAAVIGMGSMGTGITQTLAQAGLQVIAIDQDGEALSRGRARIESSLANRVARGRLSVERQTAILESITTTTHWEDAAEVDLAIESVFEDLDTKRTVLQRIQQLIPEKGILASNTSTLSLDALADGLSDPQRLIGLHFFNPAPRMPLVEVIPGLATAPVVTGTVLQLAKRLKKIPVLVKNREGFVVNRIFVPYLQEAFALLEDGADPLMVDRAAVQFGFPMGPFVLIDMAGIDILVASQEVLRQAYPYHGRLSAIATRLVQQGHCGQKSGAGVYAYGQDRRTPQESTATQAILASVRQASGQPPQRFTAEGIIERLVLRMVSEALRVLQEGIVRDESDLDVAMVLGTGFPDFHGGVMKYARAIGLESVSKRLEALGQQVGERYLPAGPAVPQASSG